MSDARLLLRQQRASKRIVHPSAFYSDNGKLQCTICHEVIRTGESGWDGHIRSSGHRQRLQPSTTKDTTVNQEPQKVPAPPRKSYNTATPSDAALLAQLIGSDNSSGTGSKRKHSDTGEGEDEDVGDTVELDEETIRRKRSKQEISPRKAKSVASGRAATPPAASPSLMRRASGTPSQGVELQIPSRPATPGAANSGASSTSTPKAAPLGKSPLIPQDEPHGSAEQRPFAVDSISGPVASFVAASGAEGEDDDWAAFESEVVNAAPKNAPVSTIYSAEATISSAPMTREQIEAASRAEQESEQGQRNAAESAIADDKEEATRALEAEFEDMEDLEARLKRLKDQREALRQTSIVTKPPETSALTTISQAAELDRASIDDGDDDDVDGDGDDEDDEWSGFRFRA